MTLITGDRVVVVGKGYRVEPGPGRQVGFMKQVREGHLYVISPDARPLIASGVLDRRLFDVTRLLEWRYGDADTTDIPLITQSSKGLAPPHEGARQTRQLSGLGMTTLRVPKAGAAQTWKDLTGGARGVGLDSADVRKVGGVAGADLRGTAPGAIRLERHRLGKTDAVRESYGAMAQILAGLI
ncbi:hypothetical protein [Spongiactinospora gelatinilytica]|uniref:hypothetical protein n=1 Tax=Spongiactinospora gelatinilytica TaxID=2666298 RepID=UPI001314A191|nr:hypothetical protein [Spongiactinospora gelatinilytica]